MNIPWRCIIGGWESAKETFWSQHFKKLEILVASEIHAGKLHWNEVITPKNGGHFIFPIADGRVKLSGRDQVFRKSTSIRDHAERGEERRDELRGESDGSQQLDTMTCDSEARNDYCSIKGNHICRHHVEPRVKIYVSKEESLPIPLRYIDVVRRRNTTLDVESRKTDDWNVDDNRNHS